MIDSPFLHNLDNIKDKNLLYKLKIWNSITLFLEENKIYTPIKTTEDFYIFYFKEQGFNGYVYFGLKNNEKYLLLGLFIEDKNSKIAKIVKENYNLFNTKKLKFYLNNNPDKKYITITTRLFVNFLEDEEYILVLGQELVYEISRLYKNLLKIIDNKAKKKL